MFALLLLTAIQAAAGGFPSVESFTDEVRSRTQQASPADTMVAKVVEALVDIQRLPTVKFDCAGFPGCLADRIYYEQASVDANVSAALRSVAPLIRAEKYKEAAELIQSVRRSVLYTGEKLVPRNVPLYPQAAVNEKLAAALAALPSR